jgi:peptidoglycan/LPS O-acetylase OafA/YrhL
VVVALYELGVFAVPLFLFISGAFMSYAARGEPPALTWKVVWTSLKRIWWPYLLWSLIFYVVVFLQYGDAYSPWGYVKNLIVGYPFHFIPLLVFYYAISPILVRLAKRFGLLLLIAIGLYQLVLMNLEVPGILGFRFPGWMEILDPPVLGNTLAQWAIYFPLGLVYSLNAQRINPWLRRLKWALLAGTAVLFTIHLLHSFELLSAPIIGYVVAAIFLLYTPLINRKSIPRVQDFEKVGKRSYGLYLTHLITIDLSLLLIQWLIPALFNYQIVLLPLLFILGVGVPMLVMERLARWKLVRPIYQYVFG